MQEQCETNSPANVADLLSNLEDIRHSLASIIKTYDELLSMFMLPERSEEAAKELSNPRKVKPQFFMEVDGRLDDIRTGISKLHDRLNRTEV